MSNEFNLQTIKSFQNSIAEWSPNNMYEFCYSVNTAISLCGGFSVVVVVFWGEEKKLKKILIH